jgi:PPOX class probable F420-dependent enzyme
MATLTEKQNEFLQNPYVGVATTLRDDGSPHSTVVWVDTENGNVLFNTALGRAKPRNLERDPRVSLLVLDPNDAYRWVAVSGRAQLSEEGADAEIDKLAKKYLNKDTYPWRKPTETRVNVVIDADKIDSYGLD